MKTESHGRAVRIVAACSLGLASELSLTSARAEPGDVAWASSSGATGAGLGVLSPQGGRFWGEGAFHAQDAVTAFSPLIGAGFFVTPDVELEIMLPAARSDFAAGSTGWEPGYKQTEPQTFGAAKTGMSIGQPYIGASYVYASDSLRLKTGGGIAWLPVELFGNDLAALYYAALMRGWWDFWLWAPRSLSLVVPLRIEADLGNVVVAGLDAGFGLLIPTDDGGGEGTSRARSPEPIIQVAPGLGFRVTDEWLLGTRFAGVLRPAQRGYQTPLVWHDRDSEQLSIEPYVRGTFGMGFFLARLTLNLDNPGYSFDRDLYSQGVWGLHAGGGFAW